AHPLDLLVVIGHVPLPHAQALTTTINAVLAEPAETRGVRLQADFFQSGCRLHASRYGVPRRPDSALRASSRSRRSASREGGSEAKAGSRTPRVSDFSQDHSCATYPCDSPFRRVCRHNWSMAL